MEKTEDNINLVVNDTIDVSEINLPHAIVTDILLENGKTAQIITLFNENNIHWEEIEIGLRQSMLNKKDIKNYHSIFCTGIQTGFFKPLFEVIY